MNVFITSLLILLSINSFSSEASLKIVCNSKEDMLDFRFQAHLIKSLTFETIGENLLMDMQSVMLSCQKQGEGYGFEERALFSNFEYKAFSSLDNEGNAVLKTVTATTDSGRLVIFKDRSYVEVISFDLHASDNRTSNLSESIPLNIVLSKGELADFNNGKKIKKVLSIYLLRRLDLNSTDFTLKHTKSYGPHTVNLTISK